MLDPELLGIFSFQDFWAIPSGHSPKKVPSQRHHSESSNPIPRPSFATNSVYKLSKSLHLSGPQFLFC